MGEEIEVEIWAQNYTAKHPFLAAPCNTNSCIRPDSTCHKVIDFEIEDDDGDVDDSTSTGALACDGYASHLPGEFRDVEVRLKSTGDIIGVMGYQH